MAEDYEISTIVDSIVEYAGLTPEEDALAGLGVELSPLSTLAAKTSQGYSGSSIPSIELDITDAIDRVAGYNPNHRVTGDQTRVVSPYWL